MKHIDTDEAYFVKYRLSTVLIGRQGRNKEQMIDIEIDQSF
jgi:hypothetical protein